MHKKVLNYRIIIEPEHYPDGSLVYNAYCPTLDVADYGDSVEEVLASIKDGIELVMDTSCSTPQAYSSKNFACDLEAIRIIGE